MKKTLTYFLAAASLVIAVAACAKKEASGTYEASQRYFEAWLKMNHPGAERICGTATKGEPIPGVAVIEDIPGTGAPVTDSTVIFVKFTEYGLSGEVLESTEKEMHQQLGSFSHSTFYGAQAWWLADDILQIGLERAIKGNKSKDVSTTVEPMRIGGKRTFVIPCWLCNTNRYSNEGEYLSNKSASDDVIYQMEIIDATSDIIKYQLDSMKRYSELHLGGIDTLSTGFYYKQLREPDDTHKIANDTTIYINYVGRLLNGQVFDTNIADTAKMYHLYSASRTYSPSEVNWSSDTDKVKLGESSVITGFAKAISLMKVHEKGLAMFYSNLGYGSTGSGSSIPSYSPLIFEIEFVDGE
ncbi:MAG: FKBP-type peptidyl-prolyl cis-trans isomerase [Bacteroidales bacterium]|nr:FKBP-type peptidyl-prolyl cis-trans isomerase [Bacteroidales bacterium]